MDQKSSSSSIEEEEEEDPIVLRPGNPFHVDLNQCRVYCQNFDLLLLQKNNNKKTLLCTVKVGDIVAMNVEMDSSNQQQQQHRGARLYEVTKFGEFCEKMKSQGKLLHNNNDVITDTTTSPWFPFGNSPWSPSQIINIWWEMKDTKILTELKNKMDDVTVSAESLIQQYFDKNMLGDDHVKVELRWFLRPSEMIRQAKLANTTSDHHYHKRQKFNDCTTSSAAGSGVCDDNEVVLLDEIYESDDVLICYAACFLGFISLFPSPSVSFSDVEVFGSLDTIFERGLLYSNILQANHHLRSKVKEKLYNQAIMDDRGAVRANKTPNSIALKYYSEVVDSFSLSSSAHEQMSSTELKCREDEIKSITNFLKSTFKSSEANVSMFIGGPPGIGKTASVRIAIRKLHEERAAGRIPYFHVVHINGMELTHPDDAYIVIWEALGKERRSQKDSIALLDKYFHSDQALTESKSKDNKIVLHQRCPNPVVLVVDEFDFLLTKSQDLIYNLFDWPMQKKANSGALVVLAISNNINMPETLFLPKVQSRMSRVSKMLFKTYSKQQVEEILEHKLSKTKGVLFDKGAIKLLSMKLGAFSGDIRQCFTICRNAIQRAIDEGMSASSSDTDKDRATVYKVTTELIQRISKELAEKPIFKALSHLTPLEALVIVSLASLKRQNPRGCGLDDLCTKMKAVAAAAGKDDYAPVPSLIELMNMLNRFHEQGFVEIQTPKSPSLEQVLAGNNVMGTLWPLITFKIDESDLVHTWMDTDYSFLSQKFLPTRTW